MSKPWGAVGAWALEAERAEAEERELAAAAPPDLFPSLKEAAASSSSKPQKKKKPTTLSLSEFTIGTHVGPGGPHRRDPASESSSSSSSKFLTHDELLRLPTGPKERTAEELEGSRGFRSYGYGAGGGAGPTARRPYGGGFDEEGRRGPPQSRAPDLDMPSRADEADNWAAGKKASSFGQGPGRQDDRYGSLGSGSSSKADEVDSWFSNKKPVVSGPPAPSRYSGFGSGFRESAAGSSDSDRWARGGGGGVMMSNVGDRDVRERPRLVLDPPKGETSTEMSKTTRASPFGAARPREEVLAEKGVDWKKMESEIEVKKTSRPTSPHSSRPSSAQSSRPGSSGSQVAGGDGGAKIRAKVNPFGDARPREVLLEEKGRDWRKMDSQLEQRRVDRPETEEEKLLKDEINNLKKALMEDTEGNMNGNSEQITAEKQTDLHEQICQREKDLDKLARELDDKVRFGQKATGSGASRIAFPSDRPPSQSGMSEDSKNVDYMERPRSRGGTGESWGKPSDERRGFQGGRESGFFGNRSMDRSRRDAW